MKSEMTLTGTLPQTTKTSPVGARDRFWRCFGAGDWTFDLSGVGSSGFEVAKVLFDHRNVAECIDADG
jgi:hypothetical protein